MVASIWQRVRDGPEREVRGLIDRELFAERATDAMLPAAEALCERLGPMVVVREACEYATAIEPAGFHGDSETRDPRLERGSPRSCHDPRSTPMS